MIKKLYKLLLLLFLFCVTAEPQNITKNVLLLNSYHQGFSWTDKITGKIIEYLSGDKFKVTTYIEYLDTKRIKPDSVYFSSIEKFLSSKYSKIKFDVIISSDDDALYFLLKYRDKLFPGTPVVACGLGSKNESKIKNAKQFFGIYDDYKEREALFKTLSILPFVKNIVFLADQTTTGSSSLESMREAISSISRFNAIYISDDTLSNIIKRINDMPESTAVIPLIFNYDKSGKFYSHSEFAKLLSNSIKFPVLATTEDQIGSGALGGFVHSSTQHSIVTANIALKVLKGENFNSLEYSKDSLSSLIYDYQYLEYYGIKETSLPPNAIIINKPVSFYQQNRTLIIVSVSIVIVLIVIIVIISINIFMRKQAEIKLRKLSYAVEQSPVSTVILDVSGIIEYVNPKYCEITGYTNEESIGRKPEIFNSEKNTTGPNTRIWSLVSSGLSWKGEICSKRKDGTSYWELVSISPLINKNGKIINYVSVCEDISDRKNNEKALIESNNRLEDALKELKLTQNKVIQQERLRSIGQMASGIAHDINNSLMPILGYSDLLLYKKKLDPDVEKKVTSIRTASLDIKRTIERMRDFYKPKIDQEKFGSVNLCGIISSTIEFTQHRWKDMAESRGIVINIDSEIEENLPLVSGNESELREVLTNLVLNSTDAMPSGGNISIKSYSLGKNVFVELVDTGIGMDEETLKHCFDPFYTTKGERGTGLGLSMVYGIMQRHRGNVELNSTRGKGTAVKLTFIKSSDDIISKTENDDTTAKSLKILCIDDSEDARELVGSILKIDNHNGFLSDSGAVGLKEFFKAKEINEPYDLVITDLGMPFMDGKSVSEAIKSKSPKTPIILMTGWGAFLEQGSIKSIDYILKKPVSIEEFRKALKSVINHY